MSTSSKTKLVALRVPNDLHARLHADAADQGLTLTAHMLRILGFAGAVVIDEVQSVAHQENIPATVERAIQRQLGPTSEPRAPNFKQAHKVAAKVLDRE